MARKERSSPEKDSEKTPQRWQLASSKWSKDGVCEGDELCGNSELSTHVISSPGVSSEADDAGGFRVEKEAVLNAPDDKLQGRGSSTASDSAPMGVFQQLAKRFTGAGAWSSRASTAGPPDASKSQDRDEQDEKVDRILDNVRVLATYQEIFQIRGADDPDTRAALATVAAAKRTEAARRAAEGIGEERPAAESLADRLQREEMCAGLTTERLESSFDRFAAAAEGERMMAEQLQRVEAREALYEQQVATEQSRVVLLRAELEAARREIESREKEVKVAEDLKNREVHLVARTQCLESIHEDARREIESLRLQRHIAEVELGRSRADLERANARQKVLEEELRLLKERPPKVASKSASSKRAACNNVVDRHHLANRCSFEDAKERAVSKDPSSKPAPQRAVNKDAVRPSEKAEASWSFFSCCSRPSNEGVRKEVLNATAPVSSVKPYS
jgi:hypothetical protein